MNVVCLVKSVRIEGRQVSGIGEQIHPFYGTDYTHAQVPQWKNAISVVKSKILG